MKNIYTKASKVATWLKEGGESIDIDIQQCPTSWRRRRHTGARKKDVRLFETATGYRFGESLFWEGVDALL